MSILQQGIVPTSAGGYEIANSLRFNDNDSAYLSRTPSSAGNRKTWTWSGWVKQCSTAAATRSMFGATGGDLMGFNSAHKFFLMLNTESSGNLKSEQVFRDVSAWYHFVVAVDTTQSTSSNRVKIYVNGEQMTDFQSGHETYPSQNYDTAINNSVLQQINRHPNTSSHFNDMYLAEVNFIDGQALDPSNFGETGDYGEWKPIKYTGTYGTNGFYLDFENSGSLGADVSGNSNNWTPNNLAATDQMLDSPTNNFAVLNPIQGLETSGITFSEGNLKATNPVGGSEPLGVSTIGMSSGKWYFEYICTAGNGSVGIIDTDNAGQQHIYDTGQGGFGSGYYYDGTKRATDGQNSYGATWGNTDIIGVALDVDAGTLVYYKNNVSQGTAETGLTDSYRFVVSTNDITSIANFGQDSSFAGNKTAQGNADGNGYGDFYYAPPTGYLALCTQNLPDATVIPSEHFNTVLYTGDGSTSDRQINGVGFQPDLVWIKSRSEASKHRLTDAVRGATKSLMSDVTNAEFTNSGTTAFNADGFSVKYVSGVDHATNNNSQTYVGWNWKANGTGVSNTDGTITSTVSANTDAGFSIVTYHGSETNSTIGHGLNSAPEVIITKDRSTTFPWGVYHASMGAGNVIYLNSTSSKDANTIVWQNTTPSSSVFYIGNTVYANSDRDYVAYCFHSVEGFSKFGSYTGNGSTDGTFVYTGFRPAFMLLKKTSGADNWTIFDSTRDTYNDDKGTALEADTSSADSNDIAWQVDDVSNGFKIRSTHGQINGSGATYIYLAFAEMPFKHSMGR